MKTIIFLLVVLVMGMKAGAQDMYASLGKLDGRINSETKSNVVEEVAEVYRWEFWSSVKDVTAKECAKSVGALYGKEVGCLLDMMDGMFIQKERVDAGDPSLRTTVRKPAVYNAVKNIEKYYKQKSKQNNYTVADSEAFAYIVKVALASVDTENTEEFEKVLQDNRKNTEEQITCFHRVKLTNLYE